MNFEETLKKGSLNLSSDSHKLRIQSKFYFTHRGNLGLLFFLSLSIFLIFISIFKVEELAVQIFLMALSVSVFIFTITVILKQFKDFVEVSRGIIKFSNNLKQKEIHLNSEFKIKVKTDIIYVKTKRPGSGSYFCIVELFLKIKDKKYRILDFQLDKKYSKEAKALGKEIKKIIIDKTNTI